jgi:hypothetical protein
MADETIYMIDQIITRPGHGRAFIDAYMEYYAPGATARGLRLDRVLVSPPMWLEDQPNTITITWTVQGVSAWWGMTIMGRTDPALAQWWADAGQWIAERSRSFASAFGDVEALSNEALSNEALSNV